MWVLGKCILICRLARSAKGGFPHCMLLDRIMLSEDIPMTGMCSTGAKPELCNFAQVTRAVADAVGPERTGIRLSPYTTFLDAVDEDPGALGSYMAAQLNPLGLAYLHMVRMNGMLPCISRVRLFMGASQLGCLPSQTGVHGSAGGAARAVRRGGGRVQP